MVPEVRLPDETRVPCSIDSATQRIAAQSYLELKLTTVLKDEIGRKLDSFSSVELDWTLSNTELGKLNKEGIVVETKQIDGYPIHGRSEFSTNFIESFEYFILTLCRLSPIKTFG